MYLYILVNNLYGPFLSTNSIVSRIVDAEENKQQNKKVPPMRVQRIREAF
jgi:hypothetical protein